MKGFTDRSTTEIVVMMFTAVTCVSLLALTIGAIVMRFRCKGEDITYVAESLNQMLSTILGALIGFVSGRAYGKREAENANGGK